MAQIIILADQYQKRPSEILGVDDDYLAYCIDEASLRLKAEAMTDKGVDWNRLRWSDAAPKKTNQDLMDFIARKG